VTPVGQASTTCNVQAPDWQEPTYTEPFRPKGHLSLTWRHLWLGGKCPVCGSGKVCVFRLNLAPIQVFLLTWQLHPLSLVAIKALRIGLVTRAYNRDVSQSRNALNKCALLSHSNPCAEVDLQSASLGGSVRGGGCMAWLLRSMGRGSYRRQDSSSSMGPEI
jgi:hypothetical protein